MPVDRNLTAIQTTEASRVLAAFIGIDKYADPGIRDLAGARRDATKLRALFADTIGGLHPDLVTDQEATIARIRGVVKQTLGGAGDNDTVILTFSGHGTHDHRLVAHDTDAGSLAATTLSLDELAEAFKQSPARAILCVLDCCFAGKAPARIFEDSPVPREPGSPLELLGGKGRVLLSACGVGEAAYEDPGGHGHGLLTGALLNLLQAATAPVEVMQLAIEAQQIVRQQALDRFGLKQEPIVYGTSEGRLTLPPLRRGQCFAEAFPDLAGVTVTSDIGDLASCGIPETVLDAWSNRFRDGLNQLQVEAVNSKRILDGESLLVVAPTTAGKTFIGELAAARSIIDGRKAVFLLPYKALVNEKYDELSDLYGELGIRVTRCTGDYRDQTAAFMKGKYEIALLTNEAFFNIVVSAPEILHQVGLVVLDEVQFISDTRRGITVELLLTYLLTSREKGLSPQIVLLSATIGDLNHFDQWLGCESLVTNSRPVPLIEGVLDRSGSFRYRDEQGQSQSEQLLPRRDIRQRRDKQSAQDVIVPLVRKLVGNGERIIVLRNRRGPTEGCASYLARELGLPAAASVIDALPRHDRSAASDKLIEYLQGGTAFHSTNLNREEKSVVERAFRDPQGEVRVLVATTTVAAGINTPASTVIIAEQEFLGENGRPFTVAEYKNIAGRAGRLGFKERGKAIVLAQSSIASEQLFQRYVVAEPEPIQSSFDPEEPANWVLRLLARVDQLERGEVPRLLANTYGGFLLSKQQPDWRNAMQISLAALLDRMIANGLVEEEGMLVRLSLLGGTCARSHLSFDSLLRLISLLRATDPQDLTATYLMALLQVLPEADRDYTPLAKRGTRESVRPREVTERYGAMAARTLQRNTTENANWLQRCKRAAVLWDWVEGVQVEEIERRYSANPYQALRYGDILRFVNTTHFHLRSAHDIATVLLVGQGPDEEEVDNLLKQLETGIPADALGLLDLPVPLERGEYLALRASGLRSKEEVLEHPREEIEALLGPEVGLKMSESEK